VAILPEHGLGVALKVADGAGRASEAAIAQILIRLGALDPQSPAARARVDMALRNWRGIVVGELRAAAPLRGGRIGRAA
jgi:L-asparaginase II